MTLLSILYCVALMGAYATASRASKPVWNVLLRFSILSVFLNLALWQWIDSPAVCAWYGLIEVAKIVLIARLGVSLLGIYQMVMLCCAWTLNLLLYMSLYQDTNVIYDTYEPAILAIAVLQLVPAANGFANAARRAFRHLMDGLHVRRPIRAHSLAGVPNAGDPAKAQASGGKGR